MTPLFALAFAIQGSTAPSTDVCPVAQEIREAKRERFAPSSVQHAMIAGEDSFCSGWSVIWVRSQMGADHQRQWMVLRSFRDILRKRPVFKSWAASGTCPQMADVLNALSAVPVSTQFIWKVDPTKTPPMRPVPVADGTWYTFSGDFIQPDGRMARVSVEENAGPIAQWVEHTLRRIDGCWKPGRPPAD